MPASVLVAYATRYGSTQEVAQAITHVLRDQRIEVDIQPMREVHSLEGYQTVVLGAPLYMNRWLKDARRFLARHHGALSRRTVAIFALGPLSTDEQEWQSANTQLDKELARYPDILPVAREIFVGKIDPTRFRFPDSLIASLPASPLKRVPASDGRNWEAIRAWAGQLATNLRPTVSQAG